jgi:maltose alpha-D-glucosyltransferase/alpha-amylase
MNHTSDQHPWFVESRSSRDNAKADWYVWNDDDQRWADARVVFVDVETSNWTYEPSRQQYYWHRFYSHQPDLNYENPEVVTAMFDVVRFWLDLGLDGFRLDAVPYLFQRDGTSGENLPRDARAAAPAAQGDRRRLSRPGDAGRGQPVAGRPRRLLRRRRRVPHVLPLPAHAPVVHGRAPGAALPHHRDPGPDAGHPRRLSVGHLPAQPRRADLGEGLRGRARLHGGRVREGPPDAPAHGHRPAAGPASRRRPAAGPAALRPAVLAAREPGHLLRRRVAHGGQPLPR